MTAYNALTRNMSADELLSAAERETVIPGSAVAELISYMRDIQGDLEALEQIEDYWSAQGIAQDIEGIIDRESYSSALMQELELSSADQLPDTGELGELWRNREDTQKMADYTAELMGCMSARTVNDLPSPECLDVQEPTE